MQNKNVNKYQLLRAALSEKMTDNKMNKKEVE